MPYIHDDDRQKYEEAIAALIDVLDSTICPAGDLNYIITRILKDCHRGRDISYDVINKIVGILECAKLEFYRTYAAPYEEHKKQINGDI